MYIFNIPWCFYLLFVLCGLDTAFVKLGQYYYICVKTYRSQHIIIDRKRHWIMIKHIYIFMNCAYGFCETQYTLNSCVKTFAHESQMLISVFIVFNHVFASLRILPMGQLKEMKCTYNGTQLFGRYSFSCYRTEYNRLKRVKLKTAFKICFKRPGPVLIGFLSSRCFLLS